MAFKRVTASGVSYVTLAAELLHRLRLADPTAGVWEAADVQWWWRSPRRTDDFEQNFWMDDDGPVAAVLFTDWGRVLGCDPILLPSLADTLRSEVCEHAFEVAGTWHSSPVETLVRADDLALKALLASRGFTVTSELTGVAWLRAEARPDVIAPTTGFTLIDRTQTPDRPHPMAARSGESVESRLRQCPLYDPQLDLQVTTDDGATAAYGLFWFDPVTRVGLVEPMRTLDAYQRRGLARALLTAGVDRLCRRGATRVKVMFVTDIARDLYAGVGFVPSATCESLRR